MTDTTLQVTAASAWQDDPTTVKQLPSGNVVRLKVPSVFALFANGRMPSVLEDVLTQAITGQANPSPRTESVEAFKAGDMVTMANVLVEAAFVEPRVVVGQAGDTVPEGAIGIWRVSDADKMAVMTWAMEQMGVGGGGLDVRVANKSPDG
jgi:hypothetical protein